MRCWYFNSSSWVSQISCWKSIILFYSLLQLFMAICSQMCFILGWHLLWWVCWRFREPGWLKASLRQNDRSAIWCWHLYAVKLWGNFVFWQVNVCIMEKPDMIFGPSSKSLFSYFFNIYYFITQNINTRPLFIVICLKKKMAIFLEMLANQLTHNTRTETSLACYSYHVIQYTRK